MRLGIGSYTFAWAIGVSGAKPAKAMDAFDLLEQAARLQVRVVQFCENLPLTRLSKREFDSFERRVRERGLEVELGTRGLAIDNLRANLKLAQRLGCSFLRLVIDSAGDEPAAEQAIARLTPILAEFEAAGVRLAIENHDRFSSATLAWIIQQLGPERVGVCLDTVNSFGALEGPEIVLQHLAPYTLCLHVKDFTVRRPPHQMGFVVEGCAAGQGRLNVPWLLAALKPSPHSFNAILESWVTPGEALDETIARESAWAVEGVRYLRRFIAEW
jgi:sugar phosphate isomerase/epimerase